MKFKNLDNIEYFIKYKKIPQKDKADGLCYNPESKTPRIIIEKSLKTKRMLNVIIEEVFHAHFYEVSEKKARKFSSNLGKVLYNKFLKKKK